jgi:hypothetical protein
LSLTPPASRTSAPRCIHAAARGAVDEAGIAAPLGVVLGGEFAVLVDEPAAGGRQVARHAGLLARQLELRIGVGHRGGGAERDGDDEGAHQYCAPAAIHASISAMSASGSGPSTGMNARIFAAGAQDEDDADCWPARRVR